MSEEEKKAIDKLKSIVKVNNVFLYNVENQTINQEEIKAIEIVLNLIEKQQKEIEELKEEHNSKYYHTLKLKELENEINNDWETKIKAKIKDLEDLMILFTNDKEKFNKYKYARDILEKILGE